MMTIKKTQEFIKISGDPEKNYSKQPLSRQNITKKDFACYTTITVPSLLLLLKKKPHTHIHKQFFWKSMRIVKETIKTTWNDD